VLAEFLLRVDGDQLYITPRNKLDARQVEQIQTLKPDLINLLKTACPKCRRPLSTNNACWRCHWRQCIVCGKDSGSEFIATCAPCGGALPD
jgi:PHP family Zn ribbon phosphoesterase